MFTASIFYVLAYHSSRLHSLRTGDLLYTIPMSLELCAYRYERDGIEKLILTHVLVFRER